MYFQAVLQKIISIVSPPIGTTEYILKYVLVKICCVMIIFNKIKVMKKEKLVSIMD